MSKTEISTILDHFMEEGIKLTPIGATLLGVPGFDDQIDDFSMVGHNKREELTRKTLEALKGATPANDFDRIARDVANERLSSELRLSESHEARVLFNLISSPVTSIRQVFEMMNKSEENRGNVTRRMAAIGNALEGWKSTLEYVAGLGKTNSKRQVLATAKQLETFSQGAFTAVAKKFDPSGADSSLIEAARSAEKACGAFAVWLRDSYAPQSTPEDGVGEDRYKMWARHFTGADLDQIGRAHV